MFHCEQVPSVGNTLKGVVPPVGEGDARAEDEHLYGAGDQDFPRGGEGGDPGTHMDRQPGDCRAVAFHFTGVQAGPDLQAESGYGVADGTSAMDGPGGAVEGGEEPITGGIDLDAAKPRKEPPDMCVMVLQQVPPPPVTEPAGPIR